MIKHYRIQSYPDGRSVVLLEVESNKWIEPNWDHYGFPELAGLFASRDEAAWYLKKLAIEMWKLGLAPMPHADTICTCPDRHEINVNVMRALAARGLIPRYLFRD
jgi:hypothetical protein